MTVVRTVAPTTVGVSTVAPNTVAVDASELSATINVPGAGFLDDPTSQRRGQAGSTWTGAIINVGDNDYIYFSHDGQGYDPGSGGRTGHECAIPAGYRTPAQMAASIAGVTSISGVTFTAGSDNGDGTHSVTVDGTDTISFGTAFASRSHVADTDPGLFGIRNDDIETADGGAGALNDAWHKLCTMAGSGTFRVLGCKIWIDSVNLADEPRLALYSDNAGDPDSLIHDFGQIDLTGFTAPGWVYVWLAPDDDVTVTGGTSYHLCFKSNNASGTALRFVDSNNAALRGDYTAGSMRASFSGAVSSDPTVAWPASWTGTFYNSFNLCSAMTLIIEDDATFRGDAGWGSLDNNFYGTHAPNATDHNTSTGINNIIVGQYIQYPEIGGLHIGDAEIAIGVNGGEYRLAAYVGGTDDATAPHNPDADGATLAYDYGQPSDTVTTNDYILHAGPTGGTLLDDPTDLLWIFFRGTGSSTILFDYGLTNWDQTTDDRDLRADFYDAVAGSAGSEYELQGAGAMTFDDATAWESAIDDTSHTQTWPGNNPGVRVSLYVPGMSVA